MKKRLLFVAGESLPFVKSGGLADVIGALTKELNKNKVDVRVVLPLYSNVSAKYFADLSFECSYPLSYGNLATVANVYRYDEAGVIFYFIQHQAYFERHGLYGYPDDGERFAFFQRAALDLLQHCDFKPQIIHCHDWHSGLIPFLGKTQYPAKYQKMKYVYTIHNLAYQGVFPMELLGSCFGVNPQPYYQQLEFDACLNFMKAGIVYADKITTVSPSYAQEILTAEFGERLQRILDLRRHDLWGIVNGIDEELWNPATDSHLKHHYTVSDYQEGKSANKKALQQKLGLRVNDEVMLLAMVSRLTWQKGVYLMIDKMQKIMANDVQLVVLGSGESYPESQFKKMEHDYRRRAVYYCGYNEELAHLIYAGADLFLMPSLFEPCGISQQIAMRYGTLPLVRETGGLKDTVKPYNVFTKEGCGFSFANYNSDEFIQLLNMAIDVYYQQNDDYQMMIQNAMQENFSWESSTALYLQLYDMLLEK